MDTEIIIPKDEPARLVSAVVEEMDLRELAATYSRRGKIDHDPVSLLKVCIYAYSRKIFSTRSIEQACRENINFMYLLRGAAAPDHNTIARFIKDHFRLVQRNLGIQFVQLLVKLGEVSFDSSAVFIDGTKIEANANKYSFVFKKSVQNRKEKLLARLQTELPELLRKHGLKEKQTTELQVRHLKKYRKKLYEQIHSNDIKFVHGTGTKKTELQRSVEKLDNWIAKMKEYTRDLHICGNRGSYCKTDHDATFMHMKEDYMRNGQLKPGYNVNVATSSQYIIGTYISADRTDTKTFIPFVTQLRSDYEFKDVPFTVDSGYESEENYKYCDENRLNLYVKPANHEQQKSRKYKSDISRRENMEYLPDEDAYICAEGKKLMLSCVKKVRSAAGFPIETTIYECRGCKGCTRKEQCIRDRTSKRPLEDRSKRIYVSKYFQAQREAMEQKIRSEEGIQLRLNRSIQAEGAFAMIKEDLDVRRFLRRGSENVEAEWGLISLAYNILKLHNKIQTGRLGTHLIDCKVSA